MSSGTLSQGMLVALINYLLQILSELLKMTMLMGTISQSVTAANRISEVLTLAEKTNTTWRISIEDFNAFNH